MKKDFIIRPKKLKYWLFLPLFSVLYACFMTTLMSVFSLNLSEDPVSGNAMLESFNNNRLLLFIVAALILPFVEELVFRKAVFGLLKRYMHYLFAALLCSAVFALAHLNFGVGFTDNLLQFIYTFFFGLILCEVTEKLGSFLAGFICHALLNAFSLFMNYNTALNRFFTDRKLLIVILSGVLLIGGIVLFELLVRRLKTEKGTE